MTEKLDTVELLRVKSSANRLYVNLSKAMLRVYDIDPGDILKVRFIKVYKPEDIDDDKEA